MTPEETNSPIGDLRHRMLRQMLRTVIEHGLKLEIISSWALAIVGGGLALVIANVGQLEKHMSLCSRRWVFVFAFLSGFFGVAIKFYSGLLQFNFDVEGKLFSFFHTQINELSPPHSIEDVKTHLIKPVSEEFLASRPWPFRLLARYLVKGTKDDTLYLLKRAARYAQWIIILLFFQVLTLAIVVGVVGYAFLWHHT